MTRNIIPTTLWQDHLAVTPSVATAYLVGVAPDFRFSRVGPATALLVEIGGNGDVMIGTEVTVSMDPSSVEVRLNSATNPAVLVAFDDGIRFAPSGTPAAVVIEDAAGDYRIGTPKRAAFTANDDVRIY